MVLSSNFEFDRSIFEQSSKHAVNFPNLMQRSLKRRESRLRQLVLKIVKVEPPSAKHPIRWKSDKQRRFVMAKLREEGNLPYQRNHDLRDAWDAKFHFDADGGAFLIENTSPIATFVIGDDQQPFHNDTGWLYAPDVIDNQIVPLVLNDYDQTVTTIADPFAGIRT